MDSDTSSFRRGPLVSPVMSSSSLRRNCSVYTSLMARISSLVREERISMRQSSSVPAPYGGGVVTEIRGI